MIKPFSDQVYGRSIRPWSEKPQLKIIDFQKENDGCQTKFIKVQLPLN